jgi:hypothetical protein
MGSISVDILEGGYVVSIVGADPQIFTSKSKVLKCVKEYLEFLEQEDKDSAE